MVTAATTTTTERGAGTEFEGPEGWTGKQGSPRWMKERREEKEVAEEEEEDNTCTRADAVASSSSSSS